LVTKPPTTITNRVALKKFNHHTIGNGMFSVAKMIGNKKNLVTKLEATEIISLLIVWRLVFLVVAHFWIWVI
jgi:hypothetical protein